MTRVIKVGGRAQSSPYLITHIASAWQSAPGSFCIVHGGGDEISALQRRMGVEPSFVMGRRVTTREDIVLVRMVLSGLANKKLVANLVASSIPAAGISGEDAGTITAVSIDPERLGRAGKPVAVNTGLIQTLLDAGYLPVISPLAGEKGGAPGDALNVNGDDAAAAIAVAIGGDELLLVADVSGVIDQSGEPIACLDQTEALELIEKGVVNGGMRAKLEAGFTALAGGVGRVRISSLEGLSNTGTGTSLALARSLTT